MRLFKIISIFFVISAGLITAYLIVRDAAPTKLAVENAMTQGGGQADENKAPLLWAEQATSSINLGDLSSQNNLTLALGKTLIDQIKSSPDILDSEQGDLPLTDINSMSQKLTGNIFSNNQLDFILTINDGDLKISSDNSKEAKANYLKAVGEIVKKDFGDFDRNYFGVVYETYGKNNPSYASRLAGIYKNLAGDFANLTAPSDWLDVHKRMILHYKNSEIVYRAMANYSHDPIRGYLALEVVNNLADNAEQTQALLVEKAQDIK